MPVIFHNKEHEHLKYSKKHYYLQHVTIWVLQTSPARIKVFKAPARKHRGNQQHSETISVLRLHDIGNGLYQATPPVQKPSAIQLDTSLFTVSCVMTRISCVRCYLYQSVRCMRAYRLRRAGLQPNGLSHNFAPSLVFNSYFAH